eukprot:scaffold20861_cov81-Isochrysis_galbana.AAC.2
MAVVAGVALERGQGGKDGPGDNGEWSSSIGGGGGQAGPDLDDVAEELVGLAVGALDLRDPWVDREHQTWRGSIGLTGGEGFGRTWLNKARDCSGGRWGS